MIKYRTCNICEALCGLEIEVKDNQVVTIKADKQDVFSKGHICPKAYALKDVHEDPDRLKQPMIKKNGRWEQVNWEEAFAFVAQGLVDIQSKYGQDAVGIYQGNPTVHNLGSVLYGPPFFRSLKTKNRFSATSLDQLPHHLAAEFMFGHMHANPVPDINRTQFWLILGGNPLVSNGSMMTAPDVEGKMRAIEARGGKVVVIDPRKTRTAKKASQHLFIRPGTDVFLLLAMLNYIFAKGKVKLNHLEGVVAEADIRLVETAVQSFTPEKAAGKTGIPLSDMLALFDAFLAAPSAVCYGRLGVSITRYGAICQWAINVINILSGNFDTEGGAMFSLPAIDLSLKKRRGHRFGRWHSRVRNLPEFGGELPVAAMAEEMLTPGEGQIRALITSCGNPVLSSTNAQQLEEALSSLEFMVSVDIYLNETTRHADVILPPATGLETPHLSLFFHNLAVHNSIKFSPPTVEKAAGAKYDSEIFMGLTIAYENELAKRQAREPEHKPQATMEQMLDYMLAAGPHSSSMHDLKENIHGIDLGALQANTLSKRIRTEDQKIDLYPELYRDAITQLSEAQEEEAGLLLFGRRSLRSMNSWLHNSYRMVKGRNICTAQVHPSDAAQYAFEDGEMIEVASRVNTIQIPIEITEEVAPGTVCIPHGWGHNKEDTQLEIAKQHAGASYSELADELLIDQLCGNAALNGIPVRVSKIIFV